MTVLSSFFIEQAQAANAVTFSVGSNGLGNSNTIQTMLANFTDVLLPASPWVMGAIFVIGAFFFIASAGDESRKGLGKGMMIGAALGITIIYAAPLIMNFTLYFIFNLPTP